mmetsp:Transcript_15198/g.21540  ORF Transcript_15198/g.21540 Transcript_15198/m.21540 type:complete len:118 (+) Transcript_15198:78-431(+)
MFSIQICKRTAFVGFNSSVRYFSKPKNKGKVVKIEEETIEEVPKPKTIPVNFLKDGEDPLELSNENYPDWLRTLRLPNLTELDNKGYENLKIKEKKRYLKLSARSIMKDNNSNSTIL